MALTFAVKKVGFAVLGILLVLAVLKSLGYIGISGEVAKTIKYGRFDVNKVAEDDNLMLKVNWYEVTKTMDMFYDANPYPESGDYRCDINNIYPPAVPTNDFAFIVLSYTLKNKNVEIEKRGFGGSQAICGYTAPATGELTRVCYGFYANCGEFIPRNIGEEYNVQLLCPFVQPHVFIFKYKTDNVESELSVPINESVSIKNIEIGETTTTTTPVTTTTTTTAPIYTTVPTTTTTTLPVSTTTTTTTTTIKNVYTARESIDLFGENRWGEIETIALNYIRDNYIINQGCGPTPCNRDYWASSGAQEALYYKNENYWIVDVKLTFQDNTKFWYEYFVVTINQDTSNVLNYEKK